jgi:hypothetical protein
MLGLFEPFLHVCGKCPPVQGLGTAHWQCYGAIGTSLVVAGCGSFRLRLVVYLEPQQLLQLVYVQHQGS